jgi:hypothetical protein
VNKEWKDVIIMKPNQKLVNKKVILKNEKGDIINQKIYNELGLRIQKGIFSNTMTETTTYNELNKKDKVFTNGVLTKSYHYNDKGLLVKICNHNSSKNHVERIFEYDENDKLHHMYLTDNSYRNWYFYDDKGLLIQEDFTYYMGGKPTAECSLYKKYDNKDRLIEVVDNDDTLRIGLEYNERGYISKRITALDTYDYIYNDEGLMIQSKQYMKYTGKCYTTYFEYEDIN